MTQSLSPFLLQWSSPTWNFDLITYSAHFSKLEKRWLMRLRNIKVHRKIRQHRLSAICHTQMSPVSRYQWIHAVDARHEFHMVWAIVARLTHRQFCLSMDCGALYSSIQDREDQANASFARATEKHSNFLDKVHELRDEGVLESCLRCSLVAHSPKVLVDFDRLEQPHDTIDWVRSFLCPDSWRRNVLRRSLLDCEYSNRHEIPNGAMHGYRDANRSTNRSPFAIHLPVHLSTTLPGQPKTRLTRSTDQFDIRTCRLRANRWTIDHRTRHIAPRNSLLPLVDRRLGSDLSKRHLNQIPYYLYL